MSAEHVISKSVLDIKGDGSALYVKGMHRLPANSYTPQSLTANILCRKHNSLLSETDSEGQKVANFVAGIDAEDVQTDITVNGPLFERWLLKSLINHGVSGWADAEKFQPPPLLVQMAFGLVKLPKPIGMYGVDGIDRPSGPRIVVSITPVLTMDPNRGKALTGAYVRLSGLPFLITLSTRYNHFVDDTVAVIGNEVYTPTKLTHLYHPTRATVNVIEDNSNRFVHFEW